MKVKYELPQSRRWAFMSMWDIPQRSDKESVYLRRLRVIQTPWWGIMVHWIYTTDEGKYPHDHPWMWFKTFILRGGYTEVFYERFGSFLNDAGVPLTWHRWSAHTMHYYNGHQIIEIEPNTVTLVFHGKRIRRFCFWDKKLGKRRFDLVRDEELFDELG